MTNEEARVIEAALAEYVANDSLHGYDDGVYVRLHDACRALVAARKEAPSEAEKWRRYTELSDKIVPPSPVLEDDAHGRNIIKAAGDWTCSKCGGPRFFGEVGCPTCHAPSVVPPSPEASTGAASSESTSAAGDQRDLISADEAIAAGSAVAHAIGRVLERRTAEFAERDATIARLEARFTEEVAHAEGVAIRHDVLLADNARLRAALQEAADALTNAALYYALPPLYKHADKARAAAKEGV